MSLKTGDGKMDFCSMINRTNKEKTNGKWTTTETVGNIVLLDLSRSLSQCMRVITRVIASLTKVNKKAKLFSPHYKSALFSLTQCFCLFVGVWG